MEKKLNYTKEKDNINQDSKIDSLNLYIVNNILKTQIDVVLCSLREHSYSLICIPSHPHFYKSPQSIYLW